MRRVSLNDSVEEIEEVAAAWIFRREAGLTSEDQAAFERWRATDPQHAAALARHERAWSALDRPRQAGQANFVLAKLADRAAGRRRRRAAAIGAACALLIAGAAFWQVWHAPPAPPDSRALVVLPETQTLPDGSIVEMKSGAEIAVDFGGPWRRVALKRGEAHFQVAHQSRPFVVTAGNVEFRAVGTAFCVHLAGTQVELLVTDGRVSVEKSLENSPIGGLPSRATAVTTTILATVDAGNRVVVGLADDASAAIVPPVGIAQEEMAERLAWRAAKLEFTETPLAEAIALMNQHNQIKLVIEDADLGKLLVSGLFRADRTEAFVRLLEANFNVRAEQAGPTTHLRRKR